MHKNILWCSSGFELKASDLTKTALRACNFEQCAEKSLQLVMVVPWPSKGNKNYTETIAYFDRPGHHQGMVVVEKQPCGVDPAVKSILHLTDHLILQQSLERKNKLQINSM